MSAFLLNNIGILQGLKSTFEKKKKKTPCMKQYQ